MLERTFIHVPGVGPVTERSLWRQGCDSWATFLDEPERFRTNQVDREEFRETLEWSRMALANREHGFFRHLLGSEAWRAWPEFRDQCVYLDIETDGGPTGEAITTVGLWDGAEFRCLVRDEDLGQFPDVIASYQMIVTFFGNGFDLPMLRDRFPSVRFDQLHVDLCPTLKRIGLRGGLKRIEQEVGITRGDDTAGLSGWDAVKLWRRYQRGDDGALETLIAYNREDVVNLETLAGLAYATLRGKLEHEAEGTR